jgi:hypothetical protein
MSFVSMIMCCLGGSPLFDCIYDYEYRQIIFLSQVNVHTVDWC